MPEKHLQVTAVSRIGFRVSLLLAKQQRGSDSCWKHSAATDLLTFLDREKSDLRAALHTQRPITSDRIPDLSLLSFHCPRSLTSGSRMKASGLASWGMRAAAELALLEPAVEVRTTETGKSND